MMKCLLFTSTLSLLVISALASPTERETSDERALNISTSRRDNEEDLRGSLQEDFRHATEPTLNISTEERNKPLQFSERTDRNVELSNNFRTARRMNADKEFEGGEVITNRALDNGEMFEVILEKVIPEWFGSIKFGVVQNSSDNFNFGRDCYIFECRAFVYWEFGAELKVGDRFGVMKRENGTMDVFINGELRKSYEDVPETVYGYMYLYGKAEQATIQLTS